MFPSWLFNPRQFHLPPSTSDDNPFLYFDGRRIMTWTKTRYILLVRKTFNKICKLADHSLKYFQPLVIKWIIHLFISLELSYLSICWCYLHDYFFSYNIIFLFIIIEAFGLLLEWNSFFMFSKSKCFEASVAFSTIF